MFDQVVESITKTNILRKLFKNDKVGGKVYGLRESRSAAVQGTPVPSEVNSLVDGTLIDLCGATLLWRSAEGN